MALLPGIYVGGKNLRLSESGDRFSAELARRIEDMLAPELTYQASVVLLTTNGCAASWSRRRLGFGARPARYRYYDILFLKPPLTAASAITTEPTGAGLDQAHVGNGALYFTRLDQWASQSA